MRLQQRLAGGHDAGGAGPQVADQLGLGGGHPLDRAEDLQVHRAHVHDHAHVRLGDLRELGDLPLAAHRHLEHERLGAAVGLEDRQRQPDLGVEVLLARVRAHARAQAGRRGCPSSRSCRSSRSRRPRGRRARGATRARAAGAPAAGRAPRSRSRCAHDDWPVELSAASTAASRCSGPTSTPQAPASSAWAAKRPPSALAPRRPTNRSPGPTSRESITARSGPARSGSPAASSPSARAASRPADRSITPAPRVASAAPREPPSRRRTAPCGRSRTPGPARGPSPRSPPRRPARPPRSPA